MVIDCWNIIIAIRLTEMIYFLCKCLFSVRDGFIIVDGDEMLLESSNKTGNEGCSGT
jgi:hypothetical protein